jgi:outer membrane protein OmpA-like peptidoglycan-associated protein
MTTRTLIVGIAALSLLGGCAADDPYQRTKGGAAIGAVSGAVIGALAGDGKGALIGAAVGALAGGAVGNYMDNQQREFEAALAEEQRRNALEIERLKDETLKLSLNSEVSFDVDRARTKPAFEPTLDKLGDVLVRYNRTVVHVVGHTDSDGSDSYNLDLSQRRADAVAGYLQRRGVPADRVRTEGRGEREPRATNATQAGKQLNRRVEIYVKPVVQGREQQAYTSPAY